MAWSPDYCSVFDLRRYVSVEDDADDEEMSLAITAASRAVDRTCNRQFGQDDTPTARYYTAQRDPVSNRWRVPIDDLMDTAGLAVAVDSGDGITYAGTITAHRLTPLNAAANGRPYTALEIAGGSGVTPSGATGAVRVTGTFGWSDIPAAVRQATLMQASRFLARRGAPFGIAGSPDAGSELRLLAKVDPDVEVALAPYRRWWVAA